ncbi:MAG: tRNA preQ1(34) S-adenosylmethionine ribosyltransferase-isomerase QueA [Alphaproteobacteria bacterium]
MKTADFNFDLPRDLIAQHPAAPRDAARLLVVDTGGQADRSIRDLPTLLAPGDVLVCNDTRVIPTRLFGMRGEARIEVTLHRREPPSADTSTIRWRAFARPGRRLKLGDQVDFAPDFHATVVAKGTGGEITLAFELNDAGLSQALARYGAMPLPPYIGRERGGDGRDRDDYQTIFAARDGAVAAPTAGLHFTPSLLRALDERGVRRVEITLHVGAGTFLPVTAEDPHQHHMHAEVGDIGADTAQAINAARAGGGRVIAVGSTALRLLETAADTDGRVQPFSGETDIFILPGYRFRVVDRLLTNFHLPRSTLFMLVCAFAGTECMQRAYAHAKEQSYRFYSYGDACLLTRAGQ